MTMASPQSPSACDYYKSWTAYEALCEAAALTSYKSVWSVLACSCCSEPECWKSLPVQALPPRLLTRIRWYDHVRPSDSNSYSSGLSSGELHRLREHFISHHQRIELILSALQPSLDSIQARMNAQRQQNPQFGNLTHQEAQSIVQDCQYASNGWLAVSQLIYGVAKNLPRIKYLQYVPALAGVSGGNSPLMMSLSAKTGQLESVFKDLTDEELASALLQNTPVGQVAQAFMDCLDVLSRCWLEHVVTATTSIGITCGTKGTPNTTLVHRVLSRLHNSRLLAVLGSLRTPLSGIGTEMRQVYEYQEYPLAEHYLELFEDIGPDFGTHSVGLTTKEHERARNDYMELRRTLRTTIWEHFYKETRPAFCKQLQRLLGIGIVAQSRIAFGLGSSVTEVLSRIMASLSTIMVAAGSSMSDLSVVLAEDEFVTFQRAAASLGQQGACIVRCLSMDQMQEYVLASTSNTFNSGLEDKKDEEVATSTRHSLVRQVVFLSLINSCTQIVHEVEWLLQVPNDVIVVLDATQAIANIPLELETLACQPNVFLVGSLIKHARCGEGLGFMTFARASLDVEPSISEPASGWTACISGLRENKTCDFESNRLLYDEELEWDGGTPSFVEQAYVATRILQTMPSIQEQHEYVTSIMAAFLARISEQLTEDQRDAVAQSPSNTMAIPVSFVLDDVPFGLDYKIVSGVTYLRIGFGIHNLSYHLDDLVEILAARKVFACEP